MSEMQFGNPWHGKTTPAGLILEDLALKTSMAGTDAAGAPKTFNYIHPGDAALGHTYYVKIPDLPTPTTPANLAAIKGEFKNDVVLSSLLKRYCPFGYETGLGQNDWLHYGSDGIWRKMRLVFIGQTTTSHTIAIYRQARWGVIGDPISDANTLIATITLTHTAPVPYRLAYFPPLDARFDGRQIVVTRTDSWGGALDMATSEGKWDNDAHLSIVAAWRIDIDETASTATPTLVWQMALPETASIPMPPSYSVATGPVFYTGVPNAWEYWEPFEGHSYVSVGQSFSTKRLVGAAFSPAGDLVLMEWVYSHVMQPIYFEKTGTMYRGSSSGATPVLPATTFPIAGGAPAHASYPSTSVRQEIHEYVIDVRLNGSVALSLLPTTTWPIYAVAMTNNVFDVSNSAASFGRFGPGAADVAEISYSPRYASFNPRANAVLTSPTPVGFV